MRQASWYEHNYSKICASAIPDSLVFKYAHKSLEKGFKTNAGLNILEIGANKGEHVSFVSNDFKKYTLLDIRHPKFLNFENPKIKFQLGDVEKLPFKDRTYDRIISTCVFHHLNDPIQGLQEIRRVVRIGGHISILLPCDPGIMYRALRRLTTLRTARRYNLLDEVQLVHALEHQNHFLSLRILINWVFKSDVIKNTFLPFYIPSYNLNAITVIKIRRIN